MALGTFNKTSSASSEVSDGPNSYSRLTATESSIPTESTSATDDSTQSSSYVTHISPSSSVFQTVSTPSLSSTEFSIVEPSSFSLNDDKTSTTQSSGKKDTSVSAPANASSTYFASPTSVSSTSVYSFTTISSISPSFSTSLVASTSHHNSSAPDTLETFQSNSSNLQPQYSTSLSKLSTSHFSRSQSTSPPIQTATNSSSSFLFPSSSTVHSNTLSSQPSFSSLEALSSGWSSQTNTVSDLYSSSMVQAPSSPYLASSSWIELSTIPTESTTSSSTVTEFSISTDSESIYYIYTQTYMITGSDTTFQTGIPTTTMIDESDSLATSTFSIPKSTITEDVDFYQKWLNADHKNSSADSASDNKKKIIGGVVGGVGGLLLCFLILFFIYWRKRRENKEKVRGFSSEIGRRAGYPLPFEDDTEDEKMAIKSQSPNAIIAQMRNKAIPPMLRRTNTDPESPSREGDPFQNEFDFGSRRRPRPPVPPPRKVRLHNHNAVHTPAADFDERHGMDSFDNRYSYISSMSESSAHGDDSTMSSTSIRLGLHAHNNDLSNSSQGFFREII